MQFQYTLTNGTGSLLYPARIAIPLSTKFIVHDIGGFLRIKLRMIRKTSGPTGKYRMLDMSFNSYKINRPSFCGCVVLLGQWRIRWTTANVATMRENLRLKTMTKSLFQSPQRKTGNRDNDEKNWRLEQEWRRNWWVIEGTVTKKNIGTRNHDT